MALLFIDGFDHYQIGVRTAKGWTDYGSGTRSMQTGRLGGQCIRNDMNGAQNGGYGFSLPSSYATLVIGFALRISNYAAGSLSGIDICILRASTTDTVRLGFNASHQLQVRNSGGTVIATGTTALSSDTWYYVELRGYINGASGECQVWLNGAQEIATTTGNFGSSNLTAFRIGTNVNQQVRTDFDDLYILDTSGSFNTSQLGDVRVEATYPTAEGNTIEWTPSTGTDNSALVDEASGTFPNGDTDYVSSSTATQKDTYDFGALSSDGVVLGLQTNLYARKDDAGTREIAAVIRHSSTDTDGATQALSTSYAYYRQLYEEMPNADSLTRARVEAAEYGIKLIT